ncbi:uncharacterized protein LY89DRAFT_639440 [Mollisia scopiformis]|uniref:Uncharacterized protein n=1 Tax=Mollisia scopiformis TaxID=149040 RepID=A0A194XNZ1_MOLSC|nr:uncharacterized protein LY89DRAFT_639440 [Mollisia scopiformis]KUJ21452.1 hypothetical protein LY89DRAFT_639440 [Mollisia scopiformis]
MSATAQIASKRTSNRYSTLSTAPSVATVHTTLSSASAQQEIKDIEDGLDKLENKKLGAQRFVPSVEKTEHLSKLALGAKLERALNRRMGGQDAVMRERKPKLSEKRDEEKVAVVA